MAKEVERIVRLQIPAEKATSAPPVGPTLDQVGINIIGFTKEFSARTANQAGLIIPIVISVYEDRPFIFITKTPPTAVLLKKVAKTEKGSGEPNKTKVATVSSDRMREIAELKMASLDTADVGAAMHMVVGTARGMGIIVEQFLFHTYSKK